MLVEYLELLKVQIALFELDAFLGIFLHQSLLLPSHLDLSKPLLLDLHELLANSDIFLLDGALNLGHFLLSSLLILLCFFELLLVPFFYNLGSFAFLLFVFLKCLPPRR